MNIHDSGHNDLMGAAYFNSIDRQQLSEADAKQAKATLQAITDLTIAHAIKRDAIRGNAHLSETGRKSELAALVAQSDQDLTGATAGTLEKLQTNIYTATRAMDNAVKTDPTVQDTLRMLDTQALCRGMDPLEVETKLIQLAESGDDDLSCHAILSASSVAPLVRPHVATKAKGSIAARIAPDHAAAIEQHRDTLAVLGSAIMTAKHSFASPVERGHLGNTGLDPIAAAARGRA